MVAESSIRQIFTARKNRSLRTDAPRDNRLPPRRRHQPMHGLSALPVPGRATRRSGRGSRSLADAASATQPAPAAGRQAAPATAGQTGRLPRRFHARPPDPGSNRLEDQRGHANGQCGEQYAESRQTLWRVWTRPTRTPLRAEESAVSAKGREIYARAGRWTSMAFRRSN